ncbi:MAG: efflux RND transporter permease subunit [Phycisphaerales bacterium]|jgi:CzcA family heavy metal efflux pump|nr:efflux RND transporter permease subunit [Phycisphaeraceae bacterium]
MLAKLIAFSLRQSSLVVVLAGLLLVFAGVKVKDMPVDVFPELNAPTVVVMTEAGGLAADEVELNVTFPIETAVNGLPGTRRVRSASATSLSIVWVEFDWGTDIYRARQLVSERLSAVRESLPPDTHAEITPVTSITGEIMLMALSSPDGSVSPLDMRSFAEFDLRNKILAVPGVAQVVAIGGELPQYQINVKQDQLALYGLTISDVVEAAKGAHSTASAGYVPNWENQELPIRQTARVTSAEDIKNTLVRIHNGAAVTIGQVADVQLGPSPKRGTASDRALPGVVISVQKSPGTNTLNLTTQIDGVLDQMEKAMPKGMVLNRDPFRASRFIERSINNVVKVLIEASVIVGVILILFLLNVRATIVTLTALPLSLAVAILLLWAWGLSINVMTLGGLAVAIGELVDDAIIDVENVLRRLKENDGLPEGERKGLVEVIYNASNEIRSSVVFATIIICMVFVPLLFLQGLEGRFFQPLGIAYIISIMASLIVALTVTPALCKWLFAGSFGKKSKDGHAAGGHGEHDGWLVRKLKRRYEPALRASVRNRGVVLGGAGLLTVASLVLMSTFGTSFLPAFKEGTFTVFLLAPPGTSLVESNRLATGVEAQMVGIEGVSSVTRRTGRAERDEHAEPVSSSEIEVTMKAGVDQEKVRAAIDRIIANIPGITTMVGQPIEHRLSHVLSGTPAAIAINVYGEDLNVLRSLAKEIEAAIKPIPGTRDVAANREILITSLPIHYRPQDLVAAGLSPAAAAEQVQQALYGETVAEVNQGVRRYEMVVRLAESERDRIDQIMDLQLRGAGGAIVRLREVADIGPEKTSNLIARENAQRKAVISTNVADGYNLGQLVAQVQAKVDPIVQKAGYTVHYGGQFEAQQSASRTILIMGAGVAVFMFLLLQLSTGKARVALLVMLNLPLALIGGIVAIFLTESPSITGNALALFGLSSSRYIAPVISIASMVGFVTLFGIAVRNGILLVNHYDHLQEREGKSIGDSIIQGSLERLVPILMTALAAMLGLVPLALAKGKPGSELLAPLAIVVLGGLVSSTFLNLFVVPAGYALAFRVKRDAPDRPGLLARLLRRSAKKSVPST